MDAKVKEKYDKELAKLNGLLDKKAELESQIKVQQSKVDKLKEELDLGELKGLGTELSGLGISVSQLKALLAGGGEIAQLIKAEVEEKKE